MPFAAQHIRAARLHLQKVDPVMKQIIKAVGPFTAKTRRDRFLSLVQSIVSQQISGAAAQTIFGRLGDALAPGAVSPESVLSLSIDQLRELGVSRPKATYLHDLAHHIQDGKIDLPKIGRLADDQVIQSLTQVKGVGVWTAQMFMMFSLGRLDVFPAGDLGIQNAISGSYCDGGDLTSENMEAISQPWRPYSTVASWYLWRSLEVE